MSDFGLFFLFCAVALVFAWLVNFLVGILRGEHPKDTGRVWLDILLGMSTHGFFLGVLNYLNASWARRILIAAGIITILIFLFQACLAD